MSSELWSIQEHIIPASHPRGLSRGVRDEETSRLRLCVKQYTPKSNFTPQRGDVTLVLAHGVGSTKESYEPLFDELLLAFNAVQSQPPAPRIRAVWAPDIAWHGASFLINADDLGDSPHWADSARDLLQLVNHFQAAMPLPIFAIGQSWGGDTIIRAALMHPRLFTGLVDIEPSIGKADRLDGNHKAHRASMMAKRRDKWASRDEARKALLRNPYFARFDARVFENVIRYDLVDMKGGGVELTTPKAMEVATMMRELHEGEEITYPIIPGFHRPELKSIEEQLRDLVPPCLYVWGTESDIAKSPGFIDFIVSRTGTGELGGGGKKAGQVQEVWVEGVTHPIPLEKPKATAEAITPWILKEAARWTREDAEERMKRGGKMWVKEIDPVWMDKISKL